MTNPLLYEVHARHWLAALGARSLAQVPDAALDALAARGVTHLWVMGAWPCGPRARAEAFVHRAAYEAALPGFVDDDVAGSPYSVAGERTADDLGGDAGLARLRARLAERRVGLVLDYVPNHLGLDHPWLTSRPELFVHATKPLPESFRVADGRYVAHGKDPYFPAWTDVAQIDHRRADARAAMIDQLVAIADRCDGVRCDMAMLALSDVFAQTWAHAPPTAPVVDGEFWTDAIAAVRRRRPGFLFLAEAYWGLEARLRALGFDYAYDKELLDVLAQRRWEDAAARARGADVARGVHFLENHDEPRAAPQWPVDAHRAAALLVLALPGARLVHDGQLEGARVRAPIQLRRRRVEPVDDAVAETYARLLAAIAQDATDDAVVLAPRAAWDDNWTWKRFVVVLRRLDADRAALAVVNLCEHRCQCRVTIPDVQGGTWRLVDRLSDERWERGGDELAGAGLYLDVDAWATQWFALTRDRAA